VAIWATWAPIAAEIEALAGDLTKAASILRESCAALERLGEPGLLSTRAAQLSAVLGAQGSLDEAERWTQISERTTVDADLGANIVWRAARAGVLGLQGKALEAVELAREAAGLAEATDALNRRAEVQIALADALRHADRWSEAAPHVEAAMKLYQQKGNLVAAERTRLLLQELAPA